MSPVEEPNSAENNQFPLPQSCRLPEAARGTVRPPATREERGNHTIYFCELLRVTVRVNAQ
jgi:hypothetical protein